MGNNNTPIFTLQPKLFVRESRLTCADFPPILSSEHLAGLLALFSEAFISSKNIFSAPFKQKTKPLNQISVSTRILTLIALEFSTQKIPRVFPPKKP